MEAQFVKVVFDLHCKWYKEQPRYRCYVEDELFAERTWIWKGVYLEEELQILAPLGKYKIRYEVLSGDGEFKVKNPRISYGPGVLHKDHVLEIVNENT